MTDWCSESVSAFTRLLFGIWTEGPDTRHSIPTLPSLTHPTPGDYCPLIDSSIGLGHQLVGEDTSLKKLVSGILLEEIFLKMKKGKFFLVVLTKPFDKLGDTPIHPLQLISVAEKYIIPYHVPHRSHVKQDRANR